MKKILAALVLLTYVAFSSGIVVSLHYCMDRFDSVAFGASDDDECGKCGMEKKDGCCNEEVVVVKIENSHMASELAQAVFVMPLEQQITTDFLITPFRNFIQQEYSVSHSPPLNGQDTYIDNCVFRI